MKQLIYRTIYSRTGNRFFRNINKFLFPVLPDKIKIPPSGTIKIRDTDKRALKISTNQTNYLTQLIYWEGYQNFEYTDIFIELIKKVSVFYDIGANIGYYSLLAEWQNKDIKVVGFEPAGGPLFYFKENVAINQFEKIKVESLALSHKEGEITFYEIRNKKYTYLQHNLAGESNAGSMTTGRNFTPVKVKTTTLNQYVKESGEAKIDLIKMDTEGTECLILEHADTILREMKPIVICETLFNTIEPELESIFQAHGYDFYNHTEEGLKKVESIRREKDNGVRNCFFVHPSKYNLIAEFVK